MPHTPPFQPDPQLFPFRSRWFDSGTGGRVHYVDEGEGAPILLLHGNPTWSFLYRGMIIRLRKRFRCIALDYPGFGLSEHPDGYGYAPQEHADVVLELVRFLDLERLTIVGHDWGGPIGLKTALDERRRVRALVMGNTWYWPADTWRMKAYAYLGASEPLQKLIVRRNLLVERMIPWGCEHEPAAEVMEHYREPFPTPASREPMAVLPRQITGASFWLEELAYAVPRRLADVPLLLAWGTKDLAFPPGLMDRWREDFRRVTTRRLPAKHFFPEDAPAEASAAIQEFLDACEARELEESAAVGERARGAEGGERAGGAPGESGNTRAESGEARIGQEEEGPDDRVDDGQEDENPDGSPAARGRATAPSPPPDALA